MSFRCQTNICNEYMLSVGYDVSFLKIKLFNIVVVQGLGVFLVFFSFSHIWESCSKGNETIHQVNYYPVHSTVCFSDLSDGHHYPTFEQPEKVKFHL